MNQKNNWETYYKNTQGRPPRKELIEAMKFVVNKGSALDMGAGALQDSKYLLGEGFSKVIALDSEPTLAARGKGIEDKRLEVTVNSFENFDFPNETFDLVNAQYSLPFIQPKQFARVFESIKKSLNKDGVFVGQLFGDRDDWSANENMTFFTKKDAEELVGNMEIINFDEEERDGQTAAGDKKHWHVFNLILRKKQGAVRTLN